MNISGLGKLTILDFPGVVSAIIFTEGCNFRCPWCHNTNVVNGQYPNIPEAEIFAFLQKRKGVLDGLVISGGEPLLQPDLIDFMSKVKALGYRIKLDTNGYCTEKLEQVLKSGLVDYVAMDIKSDPKDYSKMIGINNFNPQNILDSIALLENGTVEHEFRTTCVKGLTTAQDIDNISRLIPNAKHYYLQNFKDSGNLLGGTTTFESFSTGEMQQLLEIATANNGNTALRGV